MADKENTKVRIRILPLMGIGGVGNAGDSAWMERAEAEQYQRDGFLKIIEDEEPVVVQSTVGGEVNNETDETDDAVMKPEKKRRK